MTLSIPDIMCLPEVRTANEAGRAVLVLSASLDEIHFANTAATGIFAIPRAEDGVRPTGLGASLASRQLRAIEPVLREDGEAMLRLKASADGLEIWVTAHVFLTAAADGTPLALLTAPVPAGARETSDALAARLLAESGHDGASILSAGRVACTAGSPPAEDGALTNAGDAFLAGEEAKTSGDGVALWRVASDMALAVPEPKPRAALQAVQSHIGSLIERWRSRDGGDVESDEVADEPAADAALAPGAPTAPETDGPALPAFEEKPPAPFAARLGGEPVRFVWQIDEEGRFRQLSPEFALVVGPAAADVLGVSFAEVAEAFGFDEAGEIGGLLERRDTWSGRSIHWPVEGTDRKVLVDLAALPIYGRDRSFEGFRGFGVVRPGETVHDREAIGLILAAGEGTAIEEPAQEQAPESPPAVTVVPQSPVDQAVVAPPVEAARTQPEEEAPAFGRRPGPPLQAPADSVPIRRTVISLDERRRRDGLLSAAEEDAFKAIGAELSPKILEAAPQESTAGIGGELAAILSAVPIPLLVEMRGRLVFANPGFLQLTGYGDLDALADSGGLDALFADADGGGLERKAVRLRGAGGEAMLARVQMQRVSLSGRSCLVFSFSPVEAEAAVDPAEGALRDEVEELRSVLDTATDGILLLDPAGAIRSMNGSAEALFGQTPETYAGRHFTELLAPESRKPARDYLELLREEGLAGILNDGREIMAEVAGRGVIPLFITVGRLAGERGWCVVLRDIAHWKRAEEELVTARRQAEDASLHKSRFLANISHELRTPLNAIIGFADVMASETYGPIGHERYMEYLGDIKRSGHHVLDLVNDLLDISKIEAGKVELAFESVSLNEVVSEVVSLMQPQANRERVLVRSNLPSGIPPVVADRRTLRQIALNLVSNAIRFTPAGGQIIASTSYGDNGEVALRFRDSGIGMTDREIEIALTPFQQVNSASQERGDGTGLGLPLTKAMVEANRALFRISSTPGEGTLIEITFPAQRVLAH